MKSFRELFDAVVKRNATPKEENEFNAQFAERWENTPGSSMSADEASKLENNVLNAIKPTRAIRMWPIAMAACFTFIVATGLWLYLPKEKEPATLADQNGVYIGRDYVRLADGTTVMLNSSSELTVNYTDTARIVELAGEAYFDVFHDPAKPFYIKTGKLVTRVLGTAFSVRSAPPKHTVIVDRGRVKVSDNKHDFGIILPNEKLEVDTDTELFTKSSVTEVPNAWREEFFVLDAVPLEQAAFMIEKRFQVKVIFANPALKNCIVNAKFVNNEDVTLVMKLITVAFNLTYKIDAKSNTIIIDGEGCH